MPWCGIPLDTFEKRKKFMALGVISRQHLIDEIYRIDARKSLADFTKKAWHVLEPGTDLCWNWHLDSICNALEKVSAKQSQRLLITVPPGHMKSLLVSVFWPAWIWLTNPGWRSIYVTYDLRLTLRDSYRCRELMDSVWYKDLIPRKYGKSQRDVWSFAPDQNAKGYYENTQRGFRFSTSFGGAGTGLRGDVVVFDDPMNVEEYPTPESLATINSTWDQRLANRLNDMQTGAHVGIMQRVHENDLAGHLLKQDESQKDNRSWKPFTHLCYPSEYNPDAHSEGDPRTERGEILFAAKFPRPVLDTQRIQLGPYAYAAQHDQRPVPVGGGIFNLSWVKFWYPSGRPVPTPVQVETMTGLVPCAQAELPARVVVTCQSWDCTFKDTSSSDFVCGQVWGRMLADLFLLDQTHGRFDIIRTLSEIRRFSAMYPTAIAKYIEDKANGPAVITMLTGEISGLIPVDPQKNGGGKESRAHAIVPLFAAGNVWLPHPEVFPWVRGLLAELGAFPRGRHDDQVDSTTQALCMMRNDGASLLQQMTKR